MKRKLQSKSLLQIPQWVLDTTKNTQYFEYTLDNKVKEYVSKPVYTHVLM